MIEHRVPIAARLDITSLCNLRCLHCYAQEFCAAGEFAGVSYDMAVSLLEKLWANGVRELNILGGEPFLYKDILSLLRFACERGFQVDITTNGTVTYGDIDSLAGLGLRSIYFSLDGSSSSVNDRVRGRGSFAKTIATITKFLASRNAQESELRVNVNTVLMRLNASDVLNVVRVCARMGVDGFRLSRLDHIGSAAQHEGLLGLIPEQEFEVAEEVARAVPLFPKLWFYILTDKPLVLEYLYEAYGVVFPVAASGCKACAREIYVRPNGDVFPCLSTTAESQAVRCGYLEFHPTNVFLLPEGDIQRSPYFQEFRSKLPLTRGSYEGFLPCISCPYLTTICFPCPLRSLVGEGIVEEDLCMIAARKLADLRRRDVGATGGR